jgi:transcriptional regulator with XRE-family HTH domain
MPAECPQPSASARKLVQVILQSLARAKNQAVAEAIGKDESTVSRIASGDTGIKLTDLQPFLSALGLKVVGANQVCVDREVYESYRTLARAAINDPQKLSWDEPE